VARLREPHVIPIHAYGEIDGRLYLDMRLVDGVDLKDLLANGPLEPRRATRLIAQVASALDAAHADGLVHRDVKPSNVLVTADDFVYLVDFGIARSMSPASTSITGTGNIIGTLDYLAPERFAAGPLDGRVDVYALACVLFECLTGSRPFPVDGAAAQMGAHLTTPPPLLSLARPGLPRALDEVIQRGMAKNPAHRYATAGELAAAATAAVSTVEPVRMPTWQHTMAVPPPPMTMSQPMTGPRPLPTAVAKKPRGMVITAIAAVLVIAAVVTTLIVWQANQRQSAATNPSPTPSIPTTSSPSSSTEPPPSTPSTPSSPTTSAEEKPSAAQQKLAAGLPSAYQGQATCDFETSPPRQGAQAAITCIGTSARQLNMPPPTGARFYQFGSRADQDAFFAKLVSDNSLVRNDAQGGCHPLKYPGIYGLYYRRDSNPIPGEFTTCFFADGKGEVWWVDSKKLMIGSVYSTTVKTNDDLDKLDAWWNTSILSVDM
jgi:serine/threonine protein kinase